MCLLWHPLQMPTLSHQPKHPLWGQHILMHYHLYRPSQELLRQLIYAHFAAAAQGGCISRLLSFQCMKTLRAMAGC